MNLSIFGWAGRSWTFTAWVKVTCPTARLQPNIWGGRWDSNPRSSVPQTDALGQLRYTHHIGAPEGTRTPGPLLRRQVLYPAELQAPVCPNRTIILERVMGIEPTQPAWKAGVLPLNYTRKCLLTAWTIIPHQCTDVKHYFPIFYRYFDDILVENNLDLWYNILDFADCSQLIREHLL